MPQGFEHYLAKDVSELLEDPAFRAWVRDDSDRARAEWQALLQSAGSRTAAVRTARAILEGVATETVPLPTAAERAADFARIQARVQATPTLRPRGARRWLRIAAAVALLILAGVGGWLFLPGEQVYATGPGELERIELPDGTEVVLNANSTLRWRTRNWTARERKVNLDGEAFFAVRSEANRRAFRVETADLSVVVLGTRFNVHERRGETRVFLEEGSVRLDWPSEELPSLEMEPGELVRYAAATGTPVHQRDVAPVRHLAWTTGRLVFERTPLEEALAEIADIYDIEIQLADSLLSARELSSAGIPVDNLVLALDILEKALDLRIEATGKRKFRVYAE